MLEINLTESGKMVFCLSFICKHKETLCYFCLVLLCFRACLFINALWSPAGKGLSS